MPLKIYVFYLLWQSFLVKLSTSSNQRQMFDERLYNLLSLNVFLLLQLFFYGGMIGYEISKPQINQAYFFVSIRISKCYFYFYITQICISICLLYTLIAHFESAATVLEVAACLSLGIDLQIRYIAEGTKNFVKCRTNIIDVSVFVILTCMILVSCLHPQVHHPEGAVSLVMLVLRYGLQLWRVIELSRESKRQLEINTMEEIDLGNVSHDQSTNIIQQ